MDTNYAVASDGAKIAYIVFGSGPALLLVHGMGSNKSIWVDSGWVDIMKKDYTVIALDIRGSGESDKPYNPEFYSVENILSDFDIVVKECGFKEYSYFGHSYGATLGLQACKYKKRVKRMVCAGTTFGDSFFKDEIPEWIRDYEELNLKKKSNKLNELNLQDEDIKWIESSELDLRISQLSAMNKWKGVEVKDIDIPLAIYTGLNDNPLVVENLHKNEGLMKQRNIGFKVFDNLNHAELISRADIVSSWVLDFLRR